MKTERFDRNERFFGKQGQARLRKLTAAIIGVGGLGTHLVQQLALLGIGGLNLVDKEDLAESNRNRYVGVWHDDPVPGTRKVDLGERLAALIDPTIRVRKVSKSLVSVEGFDAVKSADVVFGCLDSDGVRNILNELCLAYDIPFFDLASDIIRGEKPEYGGRVCAVVGGKRCLMCMDLLDQAEVSLDFAGAAERRDRDAIYGVNKTALGEGGPSVVSVNGAVASLAVTEFVVMATGLREPKGLLNYYGHRGIVTAGAGDPEPGCYYCKLGRGQREAAGVERYLVDEAVPALK